MSFLKETHVLKNQGYDSDEETRDDAAIAREVQRNEDADSAQMMNTTCSNSAKTLDDYMKLAAQASMGAQAFPSNTSNTERNVDSHMASQLATTVVPDFDARNFNNHSIKEDYERSLVASLSNVDIDIGDTTVATRAGQSTSHHESDERTAQELQDREKTNESQINADEMYARQLQEMERRNYKYGMIPPNVPVMVVPDGQGGVKFKVPAGCGKCENCMAHKAEKERKRQALQHAPGGPNGNASPHDRRNAAGDAAPGGHGQVDHYGQQRQGPGEHARGGGRGANRGKEGGQVLIKIYAPRQADRNAPQQPPRDQPHHAARPRDAPRDVPRGGRGEAHGQGPAPRGRGPVRMFLIPPRREIDRRGLLNEGSRVQRAFSGDEWGRIQRNPLELPRYLGDRDAARRRMRGADIPDDDYEALCELADRLGEVKKRGLEEHDIARMPTTVFEDFKGPLSDSEYEDKTKCTICLESFAEGDRLRTLPCHHKFHKQCIDHWIKDKGVCPICRIEIKEALKGHGEKAK